MGCGMPMSCFLMSRELIAVDRRKARFLRDLGWDL